MKRSGGAYGQKIQYLEFDRYRLHWTVDRHYAGSRLRFPTTISRDTDESGARRFAKKWGVQVPVAKDCAII
jgi:hypothetical protein